MKNQTLALIGSAILLGAVTATAIAGDMTATTQPIDSNIDGNQLVGYLFSMLGIGAITIAIAKKASAYALKLGAASSPTKSE